MSEHITHEVYVSSVRKQVVDIAKSILNGKMSFVEGARLLSSLRPEAAVHDEDADFMVFAAIDSETDSLPIGTVRQYWSNDALEKLDTEIIEAELSAKRLGGDACESLILRFHV